MRSCYDVIAVPRWVKEVRLCYALIKFPSKGSEYTATPLLQTD